MILRLHLNTENLTSFQVLLSGVQNSGIQLELCKKDLDIFVDVLTKIDDELSS